MLAVNTWWNRGRWVPALLLFVLGALDALHWAQGGPSGCVYLMSDADRIEQTGRSWFPPSVTCRFVSRDQSWIEHQSDWAYYLPIALLLGGLLCAWFAVRNRTVRPPAPTPWWQLLVCGLVFLVLMLVTLLGLVAMAWRDSSVMALTPLATIPILSVGTMYVLRLVSRWPRSERRPVQAAPAGWPHSA